jgi:acyl dehydratase
MTEIKTVKKEQIFFEDIEVGAETPSLIKKYSLMKMALFASVHGDWCPGHYDHKWAKEKFNQPAPFAYGLQITTYCSQVITDWISPNGVIKKFKSRTLTPTYPNDTLLIRGRVIKKYVEMGENYIDCEVWAEKQDGTLTARGSATVTLPSKNG